MDALFMYKCFVLVHVRPCPPAPACPPRRNTFVYPHQSPKFSSASHLNHACAFNSVPEARSPMAADVLAVQRRTYLPVQRPTTVDQCLFPSPDPLRISRGQYLRRPNLNTLTILAAYPFQHSNSARSRSRARDRGPNPPVGFLCSRSPILSELLYKSALATIHSSALVDAGIPLSVGTSNSAFDIIEAG